MASIFDFMMKEEELNKLIAPKTSSLSDCVSSCNPVMSQDVWTMVIDGIASGTIKGYQDLMQQFDFDIQVAMAIWENNKLIKKISNVLVNQAKSSLLTRGVKKLEDIYSKENGDVDQAISAIDKLVKIVNATEEKKEVAANNVNIQFTLENVLRASSEGKLTKKGFIDV